MQRRSGRRLTPPDSLILVKVKVKVSDFLDAVLHFGQRTHHEIMVNPQNLALRFGGELAADAVAALVVLLPVAEFLLVLVAGALLRGHFGEFKGAAVTVDFGWIVADKHAVLA